MESKEREGEWEGEKNEWKSEIRATPVLLRVLQCYSMANANPLSNLCLQCECRLLAHALHVLRIELLHLVHHQGQLLPRAIQGELCDKRREK